VAYRTTLRTSVLLYFMENINRINVSRRMQRSFRPMYSDAMIDCERIMCTVLLWFITVCKRLLSVRHCFWVTLVAGIVMEILCIFYSNTLTISRTRRMCFTFLELKMLHGIEVYWFCLRICAHKIRHFSDKNVRIRNSHRNALASIDLFVHYYTSNAINIVNNICC
jgi:hypothetical protein